MLANQGSVMVRVLTAVALSVVALLVIWAPFFGFVFAIFVALMAGLGQFEFYGMARAKGYRTDTVGAMAAGISTVLSAFSGEPALVGLVFFSGIALVCWSHILRGLHTLPGIMSSIFGILYAGWMPAHFVLLRVQPDIGSGLVTLLIVAVALSDSGAFFVGKAIGEHKLAPRVSPNKTWEGSIGGLVCAGLGMGVIYVMRNVLDWQAFPDWGLIRYVFVGLFLAAAGQVGDLMESMLKRDAGVKDSGTLFPGHGGALDRCDGLLFAGPVLYYLIIV